MSDRGPREEVANILRQFHSRSCYPQAMDFEVDAAVDALLQLLTEPISDAGRTVADGLVLRPCPHCGESLVLKGDHHGEWWGHANDVGVCIHAITQLHDKEDFAAWNRRSPIAPTAVEAPPATVERIECVDLRSQVRDTCKRAEAAEARLAEAEREATEDRRLVGDLRARIATLTDLLRRAWRDDPGWLADADAALNPEAAESRT